MENSLFEIREKEKKKMKKKRRRRRKKSLLMTGCPPAVRLLHRPFKVIFRRVLPWTPWSAVGGRNAPPFDYPSVGRCSQRKTCSDRKDEDKKKAHKGGKKRKKNQNNWVSNAIYESNSVIFREIGCHWNSRQSSMGSRTFVYTHTHTWRTDDLWLDQQIRNI